MNFSPPRLALHSGRATPSLGSEPTSANTNRQRFHLSNADPCPDDPGHRTQREAVTTFAATRRGEILAEYVEVESGKRNERPALADAIAHAKRTGSTLLIARIDRLARSVAFISSLMESKTEFVAVDAPYANRLMLHLLAAFAEHEREQISARTRAALAAAKARGVKLGINGRVLADQAIAEAVAFCQPLEPDVREIMAGGARNLREVAAALNVRGIPARLGGPWWPSNTAVLMKRLDVTFGDHAA